MAANNIYTSNLDKKHTINLSGGGFKHSGNRNCAIILAAGQGSRFGEQKQYINFFGKPLWQHVYDKIIKIISKEDTITVGIDIQGGKTRSESVIKGLEYLYAKNPNYKKLIILEAARPLVTTEQIKELLNSESDSATFVMPLVNTPIKRNGEYINRDDYYDLLTPQAFDFKLLFEAYKNNTFRNYTDETRLMFETYGIKPHFITGGQNLIKLTYIKDLPILEKLYIMQKEGVI